MRDASGQMVAPVPIGLHTSPEGKLEGRQTVGFSIDGQVTLGWEADIADLSGMCEFAHMDTAHLFHSILTMLVIVAAFGGLVLPVAIAFMVWQHSNLPGRWWAHLICAPLVVISEIAVLSFVSWVLVDGREGSGSGLMFLPHLFITVITLAVYYLMLTARVIKRVLFTGSRAPPDAEGAGFDIHAK